MADDKDDISIAYDDDTEKSLLLTKELNLSINKFIEKCKQNKEYENFVYEIED